MSDDAAAERKAAQAARQAKLLAKSQERLAKITGAAPAGRIPNDASLGIPTRPKETAVPQSMPSLVPAADDDPAEIDLASEGVQRQQAAEAAALSPFAFGGTQGRAGDGFPPGMMSGGAGGAEGNDMFAQMLAQMTGAAAGNGGPQGAGFGGMFGSMAGPGGAGPSGPPTSPFPPPPKTLLDRVFPLVHFVSMVGLAFYAVMYLEPASKAGVYGNWTGSSVDWRAWGSLTSHKPTTTLNAAGQTIGFGIAQVPLLWLFVSVELVLQTTRLFLVRNRAQAPGILNSILPLVAQFSQQLALVIQTGVRYFALVSVLLTDLSVLVFCIGAFIVIGKWKTGGHAVFIQEAAEAWEHFKDDL